MIEVEQLSKIYKVHKRAPGLGAAFKSLFHRTFDEVRAVDSISFSIAEGERVGFLGPERRRQDHHPQDAGRPAAPHARARPRWSGFAPPDARPSSYQASPW